MHNCTQLGIQLLPSFQDFCFFVSAFTVHSPPDVDNEQINQGQQCGTRFTTAEVRLDAARAAATSEALQDQYIVSFEGSTEVQ